MTKRAVVTRTFYANYGAWFGFIFSRINIWVGIFIYNISEPGNLFSICILLNKHLYVPTTELEEESPH